MSQAVVDADTHSQHSDTSHSSNIKPYVYLLSFASFIIITGLMWDIAWHQTFGRDRFFAPPHDLVYTGALVCSLVSGFLILKRSFWGSKTEKDESIRFWWIFYAPLGGLFCVWGGLAMLTAAPFDEWWHSAFGLDTRIFSPPHALLGAGLMTIQFGTYISVIAAGADKVLDKKAQRIHNWLFAMVTGSLLASIFMLFTDKLEPGNMHGAEFYKVACAVFPVYFFAASRASKSKWGATIAAAFYMMHLMVMIWALEFIPAKPLLAPILNHITHYQPYRFPLLLVFPAIAIDLVVNRMKSNLWVKAIVGGLAFFVLITLIQWNFGTFYHTSPYSRNWFFASWSWNYNFWPYYGYRYAFDPRLVTSGAALVKGLSIAAVLSIVSCLVGYYWGGWIKSVKR